MRPDFNVSEFRHASIAIALNSGTSGQFNRNTHEVTDLIGVRALHLYKHDWKRVHDHITTTWEIAEGHKVIAYVRDGDEVDPELERHCSVVPHERGYRSIHYVVQFKPNKNSVLAEIQVRTLFEEAWSEIDHQFAYPNLACDPLVADYLQIFNGLAGSADRMGSFIRMMRLELDRRTEELRAKAEESEKVLSLLKSAEAQSKKNDSEKFELQRQITRLQAEKQAIASQLAAEFSPATLASRGVIFSPANSTLASGAVATSPHIVSSVAGNINPDTAYVATAPTASLFTTATQNPFPAGVVSSGVGTQPYFIAGNSAENLSSFCKTCGKWIGLLGSSTGLCSTCKDRSYSTAINPAKL